MVEGVMCWYNVLILVVYNFLSAKNVYTFQVFTAEFCQEFIEEISNFESTDLPKGRPNTMNNYGVRLND